MGSSFMRYLKDRRYYTYGKRYELDLVELRDNRNCWEWDPKFQKILNEIMKTKESLTDFQKDVVSAAKRVDPWFEVLTIVKGLTPIEFVDAVKKYMDKHG